MSEKIVAVFPDGEEIHTYTNPQLTQYEDYYHKGKWYNISELKTRDDERGN